MSLWCYFKNGKGFRTRQCYCSCCGRCWAPIGQQFFRLVFFHVIFSSSDRFIISSIFFIYGGIFFIQDCKLTWFIIIGSLFSAQHRVIQDMNFSLKHAITPSFKESRYYGFDHFLSMSYFFNHTNLHYCISFYSYFVQQFVF